MRYTLLQLKHFERSIGITFEIIFKIAARRRCSENHFYYKFICFKKFYVIACTIMRNASIIVHGNKNVCC